MLLIFQKFRKKLQTLFYRNKKSIPSEMTTYPIDILPHQNLIRKIDVLNLNSQQENIVIIRRSAFETEEDTFDELGILKDGALYTREGEIEGLSLNLLGGNFSEKDIKWRQIGSAMQDWTGDTIDLNKIPKEELIELDSEKICAIPLSLKSVLEIEVPYNKSFVNDKKMVDKEIAKSTYNEHEVIETENVNSKKIKTDTFHYKGSVSVEHVPTISNYWHVQMDLTEDSAKQVKLVKIKSFKPSEDSNEQHHTTKAALEFFQRIKIIPRETKELIPCQIESKYYLIG